MFIPLSDLLRNPVIDTYAEAHPKTKSVLNLWGFPFGDSALSAMEQAQADLP